MVRATHFFMLVSSDLNSLAMLFARFAHILDAAVSEDCRDTQGVRGNVEADPLDQAGATLRLRGAVGAGPHFDERHNVLPSGDDVELAGAGPPVSVEQGPPPALEPVCGGLLGAAQIGSTRETPRLMEPAMRAP
jgi:hypothetical protein